MYQQQDIELIVQSVVKKLKTYDIKLRDGNRCKWEDIPEFWKGYKKALSYMKTIKVHAEIGDFPEDLFAVRAPNETEQEAKYIKANYKQNTLPVFMDYISTMTRPFFDGNWSINYQTDKWSETYVKGNQTLQAYVESDLTAVGNVENYIKQIVAQLKAIDANGVIAVKVENVDVMEVDGELVVDNSKLFEPIPVYYSCDKILAKKQDEYYLIKTDEEAPVTYGNAQKEMGHVFEFYDEVNIWKIVQIGNFVDYRFEYYVMMEHGWDRVPVMEMMGVPQMLDSKNLIYISPFHFSVPNLNNALVSTQYLNASKDRTMFPYLVMVGRPCNFEKTWENGEITSCSQGKLYNPTSMATMECPGCHGTGQKDRVSPFGVLLLNPDSEFNKGDASLGQKAMYYVAPDPESLRFVQECISKDFEDARKILHQQTSNSMIKGTENLTATGMSLDTKAMFAFVKTPSDQMFTLWEFILDAIGWMRYGDQYVKAILTPPVTFDYNTDQDYLLQIGAAQKAGLPPWLIHSIIFRYLQTLYYNEVDRAAVFSLIINTDRLLALSQQDIMLKFSRGLCQDWEIVIHDSAINLISELITANENFLSLDFKVQQDQLIAQAKTKAKTAPLQIGNAAVQNALQS